MSLLLLTMLLGANAAIFRLDLMKITQLFWGSSNMIHAGSSRCVDSIPSLLVQRAGSRSCAIPLFRESGE